MGAFRIIIILGKTIYIVSFGAVLGRLENREVKDYEDFAGRG